MQWRQEGCAEGCSVVAPVGIWWVQLGLELGSWGNGDCRDLFSPSTPKFGMEELRSSCVKKDAPTGIWDLRGMEVRGPLSSPAHQNQEGKSWDVLAMPGGMFQLG